MVAGVSYVIVALGYLNGCCVVSVLDAQAAFCLLNWCVACLVRMFFFVYMFTVYWGVLWCFRGGGAMC